MGCEGQEPVTPEELEWGGGLYNGRAVRQIMASDFGRLPETHKLFFVNMVRGVVQFQRRPSPRMVAEAVMKSGLDPSQIIDVWRTMFDVASPVPIVKPRRPELRVVSLT